MKGFKNIFFGLLASGTIILASGPWLAKAYAQSTETTTTTVAVNEASGTPNWDYPAERGPWPKKLGLTDEQMTQLVSLKSEYVVNTAKQKAELQANIKKMVLLMTEPKLDKQAVFSLNDKINSIKSSLADAHVNQMLSVMNVMTPQQREQMRHHMLVHALSHHHSMACKNHKGGSHHHSA